MVTVGSLRQWKGSRTIPHRSIAWHEAQTDVLRGTATAEGRAEKAGAEFGDSTR